MGLTQSSVISQCWSEVFFQFYQNVIIVMYAYFINISQNSVETHLWSSEICNNRIIANCLQSVPVEEL